MPVELFSRLRLSCLLGERYDDERTWLVFNLNGEEAAEEYIILGIVMKAKYIIGLGIMMKLYGGISFLSSTYPGALILYVNETLSADNGASVAMCHHESIDQELRSQKFCDLVNEIERQANSNPLFTQSKVNTFFMPFIKVLECPMEFLEVFKDICGAKGEG
ncbi:hypothetical protein F2Q69_00037347 [Brassica cretica]|uniref:Uncharacterized protein n=1 Tax=Brassica cretica TaxID=69181 RepID=A0A8S9SMX9_BRACR|nr:hypothetical protein F2Q69_00037347 [Brassica cretica]